jgi:phosphatidylethanolamine/phosphatidyl-N-methylethanolamine N-methyltransferase
LVTKIIQQIDAALSEKGRVVQFTYDLRKGGFDPYVKFSRSRFRIVWMNVPPARVDVFRRTKIK